jgi:hypothetical protein
VLAIVHQRDAGPGVFAEAVAEAGGELDEWFIAEAGDPPADPSTYDAARRRSTGGRALRLGPRRVRQLAGLLPLHLPDEGRWCRIAVARGILSPGLEDVLALRDLGLES